MKKIIFVIVALAAITSCGRKERDQKIANLSGTRDSLVVIVDNRDSIINDALITISDIAASITDIRRQEGAIIDRAELGKSTKDQVKEDLEAISSLLKQKRQTIARLERSTALLKKANVEISGLKKLVEEMSKQLEEKDQEISKLLESIDDLNIEISRLGSVVDDLNKDKQDMSSVIDTKTNQMNEAFYIVGTEKELIEKGILVKSGLVGRTLSISDNLDKNLLTKIDIRNVDKIEIKGKKAEVVGSFPQSSYKLEEGEGKRVIDALIITNKDEFWENGKILVISYK